MSSSSIIGDQINYSIITNGHMQDHKDMKGVNWVHFLLFHVILYVCLCRELTWERRKIQKQKHGEYLRRSTHCTLSPPLFSANASPFERAHIYLLLCVCVCEEERKKEGSVGVLFQQSYGLPRDSTSNRLHKHCQRFNVRMSHGIYISSVHSAARLPFP